MLGDLPRHRVLEVGLAAPPFLNRHMGHGRRDGLRTGHGNRAVEAPGCGSSGNRVGSWKHVRGSQGNPLLCKEGGGEVEKGRKPHGAHTKA